ncbi:MAG: hypothetical protein ACTSQP_22570 [Promethearchaeota archaeon]
MKYNKQNFYPIQRKPPIEMSPEWKFVNGFIDDLTNALISRGLQYIVEKFSNWYSEWRIKFQQWLRNNWNW